MHRGARSWSTWLRRDFSFSASVDAAELLLGMLQVSPRLRYNQQLFLVLGKRGWKPGKVLEKWRRELLGNT